MLYKNLPGNKLHRILLARKLLDGIAAVMFILKGRFEHAKAVWKSHLDYYKNTGILKEKRKIVGELTINKTDSHLLNKSIVFRFYIKGEKTFTMLNIKN
jgi:hypothetical protein